MQKPAIPNERNPILDSKEKSRRHSENENRRHHNNNEMNPINTRRNRTSKNSNSSSGRKVSTEPSKEKKSHDKVANKVLYNSSDHWAVITQMHGSVWPQVISYCLFNVLNTLFVIHMKGDLGIDLSFSDRGHTFMSMMVSFLMVTRSNIAYSRYMEARLELSNAMNACRELISYATTFTRNDDSQHAKYWRVDLANRTIKLLRTMVSVLEYQSTGNHAWKVPILSREEKKALHFAVQKSNERTPMVLTMFVRTTIAANVEYLDPPLHHVRELKLYSLLSDFVGAYHGLMKLVSTPFPFPLVQMTRTFLFVWIFTLPWVLVNDITKVWALLLTVFFITFAFVGLEFVAIELDDPFGDDPNDFDVLGLAHTTFKDIYVLIFDLHGKEESKEVLELISHCVKIDALMHDHNTIVDDDSTNMSNSYRATSQNNLFASPRPSNSHRRLNSETAHNISVKVPKRREAGAESSILLTGAQQNSSFDTLEANDGDIILSQNHTMEEYMNEQNQMDVASNGYLYGSFTRNRN